MANWTPIGLTTGHGFVFRGAWVAQTAYEVNDVVTDAGSTYICTTANTAPNNTYRPSLPDGATRWALWAAKGEQGPAGAAGASGLTYRGAWTASATYAVSDLVTWGGSGYVATAPHAAGATPPTGTATDPGADDTAVTTGWELLVLQGATGPVGATGAQGVAGPAGPRGFRGPGIVAGHGAPATETFNGNVYIDIDTGDVYQATGTSYQDVQVQALAFRGAWQTGITYAPWDVITHAGSSYFVATGFTSGTTFSTNNLIPLAQAGQRGVDGTPGTDGAAGAAGPAGADGKFIPQAWTEGATYAVNDLVLRNEATWRVARNHTAATWNDPAFGPLVNYLFDPNPTSTSGLTSLFKTASNDTTKSASASGRAVKLSRSSEAPMTEVTAYVSLNSAQSDTARLRGKYCLFRVHVYSTETRTFRVMLGTDTTASEPPPTGNQVSNNITVPANTLTPITLLVVMPYTTDLSLTVMGTTGNTTDTMETYFSGWQVSELPSTYPGDGSDVPFVEGYTSTWAGDERFSVSILRTVQPLTPPATPAAPLMLDPRGAFTFNRVALAYSSTKTYAPGEQVFTWDGAIWEATTWVPTNLPPTRYNWVPNPAMTNSDEGYTAPPAGTNLATFGGDPTVSRVMAATGAPNLSSVWAIQSSKPAGTATSSTSYFFMDIGLSLQPAGSNPTSPLNGIRYVSGSVRVWANTTMSANASMWASNYNSANYGGTTFGTSTTISANTWTTLNFSNYSASGTLSRFYLRVTGSVLGTAAVNLQVQSPIVDDYYFGYDVPRSYFDGGKTLNGYTTTWRRLATASPSVAVATGYWRMVTPGTMRGAHPVGGARLMQDVELHYNAGSRTMGF